MVGVAAIGGGAGLGRPLRLAALAALEGLLHLLFQSSDASAQVGVLRQQLGVVRHHLGVVRLQGGDAFQQLRPVIHEERIVERRLGSTR